MNRFVVDTHAMFWYLTSSPRLGRHARDAFASGVNGEAILTRDLQIVASKIVPTVW